MKNYISQLQKITLAVVFSLLSFGSAFAQVAETAKIKDGTISNGATKAKDGAIFELESNNKGMLTSRLTTQQRNAIPATNLSNGLLVYNATTNCFDYWDAVRVQWLSLCGTPPPAVFDISTVQCSAIVANGAYKQGVTLSGDNTLTVPVTVTQPGTYTITATTANGYYFETSGNFPSANSYELTLRGTGRPNSGYASGEAGDVVSLVLNGAVNSCAPNIYVEKASVDFTVNCASIVASGAYNIGLSLTTANKLTVSVNVTSPGFWSMSTNTVNGYSFSGQDTFTTTGLKTVELFATGTPIASGTDNFNLSSNANTPGGASCSGIPVTVAPVAYTMNCAGATQSGTYMQNVALNTASNTITVPVNVTATGSTTISTNTVNGVSFSSGPIVLTALGAQDVVLKGSGTPLTGDTTALTVTGAPGVAATCSVNLVIAAQPVAYTMTCGTIATAGNYAPGLAMDPATNTMTIPVTVTYAGGWTASTNTVNGVTFSGSGTFSTIGGGQSITLKASGTPTSGGPFTFTITTNSNTGGTCTKAITFIYRTMNVLALGYGIYAPYTASSTQATRAILQNTASFGPTGKVQMQGFKIEDGGNSNSNAALLKTNITSKSIDIIVMMYNVQPNAAVTAVLAEFVKNKKGVLIHGQELGDSSNAALIAAICGGSPSIGSISHNNNIVTSSDPVIDGPFGNISGKRLGVDAGVTGTSASNLPAGVTVLSTRGNGDGSAFAFKHSSLGYLWIGDGGGFAGNTGDGSGDIYPAKISATGLPMDKSYTGGTVSNSTFYANAMAWAVKYAQENVVVDYVFGN